LAFDRKTPAAAFLTELARDHLELLGVEFGLRAIRQSLGYLQAAEIVGIDAVTALNNVILHKVLPKLTLDTARRGTDGRKRYDVLIGMRDFLNAHLNRTALAPNVEDSVAMLDRLIAAGEGNNGRLLLGSGVVASALKTRCSSGSGGFRGGGDASCHQPGYERAEQGSAAAARVVHELEEAKVEGKLVLRDAPMGTQPGTQERPKAFDGVDMHLAEAVAILVARILSVRMANGFVLVTPDGQTGIDVVLISMDQGVWNNRIDDDWFDRGLLHVW
jgi:hypothetical protein